MENNDIIVICGFSGSGKDTLAKLLSDLGYNFIVSTTNRPMRAGESQKNPYNFVTTVIFEKLIKDNDLIEYRTYNTIQDGVPATWYYGIENGEIVDDKKYVVVLDIHGLKEIKSKFGNRVKSFFIDVSEYERRRRAILRGGFEEAEFNRRLADDTRVFSRDVIEEEVDYIVNNSDQTVYNCLSDVIKLIHHVCCDEMEGL